MGLDLEYIYGQTPVSEEEKDELLIKSISARSELDEFEQQNIETAVEWTLSKKFKKENILSERFILGLHKRMFYNVWKWAGTFRRSNKNIGVDKFQIGVQLNVLTDDCNYWIDNSVYHEDEIAIRFKHRIVSIHPFANGNGRHARLMGDVIVSNIFNQPVFTWGRENITSSGIARKNYIDALQKADQGDIQPLLVFARL